MNEPRFLHSRHDPKSLSKSEYQPTDAQKKWAKYIFPCEVFKEDFPECGGIWLSLERIGWLFRRQREWGNPVTGEINQSEGLRVKAGKTIWLEGKVHARVGRKESRKAYHSASGHAMEARQWRQSNGVAKERLEVEAAMARWQPPQCCRERADCRASTRQEWKGRQRRGGTASTLLRASGRGQPWGLAPEWLTGRGKKAGSQMAAAHP